MRLGGNDSGMLANLEEHLGQVAQSHPRPMIALGPLHHAAQRHFCVRAVVVHLRLAGQDGAIMGRAGHVDRVPMCAARSDAGATMA